jgi:hypothetical protein
VTTVASVAPKPNEVDGDGVRVVGVDVVVGETALEVADASPEPVDFVVDAPDSVEVQAPRKTSAATAAHARRNDLKESPNPIERRRGLTGLPPYSVGLQPYASVTTSAA